LATDDPRSKGKLDKARDKILSQSIFSSKARVGSGNNTSGGGGGGGGSRGGGGASISGAAVGVLGATGTGALRFKTGGREGVAVCGGLLASGTAAPGEGPKAGQAHVLSPPSEEATARGATSDRGPHQSRDPRLGQHAAFISSAAWRAKEAPSDEAGVPSSNGTGTGALGVKAGGRESVEAGGPSSIGRVSGAGDRKSGAAFATGRHAPPSSSAQRDPAAPPPPGAKALAAAEALRKQQKRSLALAQQAMAQGRATFLAASPSGGNPGGAGGRHGEGGVCL